eukprot:scaffold69309_cov65-Phaeocystis_antarctica.AAC.23
MYGSTEARRSPRGSYELILSHLSFGAGSTVDNAVQGTCCVLAAARSALLYRWLSGTRVWERGGGRKI